MMQYVFDINVILYLENLLFYIFIKGFKMRVISQVFAVTIITVILFTACSKLEKKSAMNKVPAIELSNFDTTIVPGDDFFRYVNGGWMKNNPIPPEESRWGAFNVLNLDNQNKLKTLFEEAAYTDKHKGDENWRKIGDFYAAGMDTNKIETDGIKYIQPMFESIDKMQNSDDLIKQISYLASIGYSPLFYFYGGQDDKNSEMIISNLYQGGLNLPDRDYYLNDDARSKTIREAYYSHLQNMFKIINNDAEIAKNYADVIMKMETSLAKSSRSRLDLRDPNLNYNKMPLADLQKITPEFNWNLYLDGMGLKTIDGINVGQPQFFTNASKMLKNVSIEDWKIYLKWNILHNSAPYLSKAFVDENFAFYGKVLTGAEQLRDRWKRVLDNTSGSLGEAVGKIYVEKYFPPQAKQKMLKLVENLDIALGEHIKNLSWMSPVTKEKALEKLKTMNVKIGYPDKWTDYSKLEVSRESYLANVINANKFEVLKNLEKIGKPVDREEWHMSPQTVNAYYSPNMNEIVFPAAILQPPFFNLDADDAVNYGAIGVVIGHEMTHGFDDQGRQFDSKGNLSDWWTPEDAIKFKEKTQVLVEQFNGYKSVNGMTVNGELTLGENIADFGGLTVALTALRKATNNNLKTPAIDGFTPMQRFFISYSQVWRQNIRDEELMRRLKEDVHSPGENRVNGGLVNVPEFYEAFSIKPTNKMYVAPEKRALIW